MLLTFFSSQNSWKILRLLLILLLVQCRRDGAALKEYTVPDTTPNIALSTAEGLWGSLVPRIVHLNGVTVRRLETGYLSGKLTGRVPPFLQSTSPPAWVGTFLCIRIALPAASYTGKCGYWLHFYILWLLVTVFTSFIYRFSLQFYLVHIMAVGTGSSSACDFRVYVFILCVNEMTVIICS